MRVLVLGAGGREQALAWACRRGGHDVELRSELPPEGEPLPDLVIPGPEALLADGVADECERRGIPCFGPTAELARLESSKSYARELAATLGIPGPRFASFQAREHRAAREWFDALGHPVVVKLDGLAAGKGVTVPESESETYAAIGVTDGPFVLEERMAGPECSLIVMCDGTRAVAFPLAQDHKRVGEGDSGPNTGGMGAYAPAPVPLRRRRPGGDVRATGARPLCGSRHAVRRVPLRRAHAHRRRPASRRVQRPLRRSRGAGHAAAPRRRPRRAGPRRDAGCARLGALRHEARRRMHRRRRGRRVPDEPDAR